jgi:hypothetical protein
LSRICWIWCGSANTCGSPAAIAHDLIQIDRGAGGVPLARERLQVADDARGALGGVVDGVEIAPRGLVGAPAGEPFGAGEDRRQRVVQLVRHPRHRLAERRQLFGLRELVVEIARLILQLLPFGDVAHHRFDAHRRRRGPHLGVRRHLDPHRGAVGAPQPQQIAFDDAVAGQLQEEVVARLLVDEALAVERPDLGSRHVVGPAEHQPQVRVGGERGRFSGVAAGKADVDALTDGVEEPGEGVVFEGGGAAAGGGRRHSAHLGHQ